MSRSDDRSVSRAKSQAKSLSSVPWKCGVCRTGIFVRLSGRGVDPRLRRKKQLWNPNLDLCLDRADDQPQPTSARRSRMPSRAISPKRPVQPALCSSPHANPSFPVHCRTKKQSPTELQHHSTFSLGVKTTKHQQLRLRISVICQASKRFELRSHVLQPLHPGAQRRVRLRLRPASEFVPGSHRMPARGLGHLMLSVRSMRRHSRTAIGV